MRSRRRAVTLSEHNRSFLETFGLTLSLFREENFMPAVSVAQEWSASLRSNKLKVHGKVDFPTTGYKMSLKKQEPQGIDPEILLLTKTVTNPKGVVADHITPVEVEFEEHTTVHYTEVQILPDGPTIKINHTHSA
jgi:hypothetical protein